MGERHSTQPRSRTATASCWAMLGCRRLRPSHRISPLVSNRAPAMRVSGERLSRIDGGTGPAPSSSQVPSGLVPSMTPISAMITSWLGAWAGRQCWIERPAGWCGPAPALWPGSAPSPRWCVARLPAGPLRCCCAGVLRCGRAGLLGCCCAGVLRCGRAGLLGCCCAVFFGVVVLACLGVAVLVGGVCARVTDS